MREEASKTGSTESGCEGGRGSARGDSRGVNRQQMLRFSCGRSFMAAIGSKTSQRQVRHLRGKLLCVSIPAMKAPCWIGPVELLNSPASLVTRGVSRMSSSGQTRRISLPPRLQRSPGRRECPASSILRISHPVSEYEEIPEEMDRLIEWSKEHPQTDGACLGPASYYQNRAG